ncbi:hypothetical protein ABK040_016371 [Willaertia magna]
MIEIIVKDIHGNEMQLQIVENISVEELKEFIQVNHEEQQQERKIKRLFYKGYLLVNEEKKIEEYDIRNNSVITVIYTNDYSY